MANALKALLQALSAERLPTDYSSDKVHTALTRLGYTRRINGSHHTWRQKGYPRIVVKVDDGKIPDAAVKELKELFTKLGLL